jgi:hypothetical protein
MSRYTDYQKRKKDAIEDRIKKHVEIIEELYAEVEKLNKEIRLLRSLLK